MGNLIRAIFLVHPSILNSTLYVHVFLSWTTEILGCMFSVDYVPQLSNVSLCLLLLNCFFSELLLCVVALARLKSRRAGRKYKQWKVTCEADICGILILFCIEVFFSRFFEMFILGKKGFIKRLESASALYIYLLLWGLVCLGTPAELLGSFLWINVLCTLTRMGTAVNMEVH